MPRGPYRRHNVMLCLLMYDVVLRMYVMFYFTMIGTRKIVYIMLSLAMWSHVTNYMIMQEESHDAYQCIYDVYVCFHIEESKKEMILMLCYDFKPWGSHTFMCIICMEILPRYAMLVQTRTFDIYVYHDIMRVFPFRGVQRCISAFSSTKSGPV